MNVVEKQVYQFAKSGVKSVSLEYLAKKVKLPKDEVLDKLNNMLSKKQVIKKYAFTNPNTYNEIELDTPNVNGEEFEDPLTGDEFTLDNNIDNYRIKINLSNYFYNQVRNDYLNSLS